MIVVLWLTQCILPYSSGVLRWKWWHSDREVILKDIPDSKVHGANMGPTWVLSAPDGPHVGPMNLATRIGSTDHWQTTTKHKKVPIMCIIIRMWYICCWGIIISNTQYNMVCPLLCQSYVSPSSIEVTLLDLGKIRLPQATTKQHKTQPSRCIILVMYYRDHTVYGLSQWETMLLCNIVSHWLSPYLEWSYWVWAQPMRDDVTL